MEPSSDLHPLRVFLSTTSWFGCELKSGALGGGAGVPTFGLVLFFAIYSVMHFAIFRLPPGQFDQTCLVAALVASGTIFVFVLVPIPGLPFFTPSAEKSSPLGGYMVGRAFGRAVIERKGRKVWRYFSWTRCRVFLAEGQTAVEVPVEARGLFGGAPRATRMIATTFENERVELGQATLLLRRVDAIRVSLNDLQLVVAVERPAGEEDFEAEGADDGILKLR